jgi:hypothetical protein
MPSVLPRRHSAGSSALLQFDLLFECGSAEEAAGALQSAASVGALGVSRPPLAPRGSGLKPPALRRRGEATEAASPEAAAAFARQLAAPRGGFEHAVAAAASSALEAAAASPPCDLPLSLVTWLADRLREAFDAAGMALPPWRSAASLLARWQLEEVAPEAAPPLPLPPKQRGAAEELVLRQRNGLPFVAHVSTCSPRAAS